MICCCLPDREHFPGRNSARLGPASASLLNSEPSARLGPVETIRRADITPARNESPGSSDTARRNRGMGGLLPGGGGTDARGCGGRGGLSEKAAPRGPQGPSRPAAGGQGQLRQSLGATSGCPPPLQGLWVPAPREEAERSGGPRTTPPRAAPDELRMGRPGHSGQRDLRPPEVKGLSRGHAGGLGLVCRVGTLPLRPRGSSLSGPRGRGCISELSAAQAQIRFARDVIYFGWRKEV